MWGKRTKILLSVAALMVSFFALNRVSAAVIDDSGSINSYNATVESKNEKELTVTFPVLKSSTGDYEDWSVQTVKIPSDLLRAYGGIIAFTEGDEINIRAKSLGGGDWEVISVSGAEWKEISNGFRVVGDDKGSIWESKYVYNRLFKSYCRADQAIACWSKKVFSWSQGAIILLSTVVIVGAGIIYMTSAGNPNRVAMAKKFLFGAISGIAVVTLGKFFLEKVIGVPWL